MDAQLIPAIARLLNQHAGETLTPELVAEVMGCVVDMTTSAPLDCSTLAPVHVGSYTLQPERLLDVVAEIAPLHQAHWRETEAYRHGLPFRPDYQRTIHDEANGRYLLLTARHDGELVGNYGLVFGVSRHTQTGVAQVAPTAYEDSVFIAPAHRRGRLFHRLATYAEHAARHFGVRELQLTAKLSNRVSEMLPRLGYTHCANQFSKIL